MEDAKEELHFHECLISFREYLIDISSEIDRRKRSLEAIGSEKLNLLLPESSKPEVKFNNLRDCAKKNQDILNLIIRDNRLANNDYINTNLSNPTAGLKRISIKRTGNGSVSVQRQGSYGSIVPGSQIYSKPHNMNKVRCVLHQISREWSEDGKTERDVCFNPIISELEKHLEKGSRVLCPGVGLGRLAVEIVSNGYSCQGNEFSYHMLLASEFILNKTSSRNDYFVYPWIDGSCNVFKAEDVTRKVTFPDISISDMIKKGKEKGIGKKFSPSLSMVAGEFLEVYKPDSKENISDQNLQNLGKWDSIVTCFFLDTAPNVFEYIQRIYDLLEEDGIWVNHGPLLWHWCAPQFASDQINANELDPRYMESIELSYDEIKHVVQKIGFRFITEERHEMTYCGNKDSMMNTTYKTVLFTCIKPKHEY